MSWEAYPDTITSQIAALEAGQQEVLAEAMGRVFNPEYMSVAAYAVGDSLEARSAVAQSLLEICSVTGEPWPADGLDAVFRDPLPAVTEQMQGYTAYIEETYRYHQIIQALSGGQPPLDWSRPDAQTLDPTQVACTALFAYRENVGLGSLRLDAQLTDASQELQYRFFISGVHLEDRTVLPYALSLMVTDRKTDTPLFDLPEHLRPAVTEAIDAMLIDNQVAGFGLQIGLTQAHTEILNVLADQARAEIADPVTLRNRLEELGIYE